jgi:hypothetical protein
MRHLGFTGTKNGMKDNQKFELVEYLRHMKSAGYTHFHHGDCIGADSQAAGIAKQLGYYLIAHPGHPKDKTNTMYRAFTKFNDEVLETKPFIDRDHDIVDASTHMIATPAGEEQVRSGTWTTVRYALKREKPVHIILPPVKLNTFITGGK